MKPSDLSNEDIARALESIGPVRDAMSHAETGLLPEDYMIEAAARLRNSIPKPVVWVGHWVGDLWVVTINGTVESEGYSKGMAESHAKALRTALGINDTEGGE